MDNIIGIDSLNQRRAKKEIDKISDAICGNVIADALIQITQEINAVMLYARDNEYNGMQIGEILKSAISEKDSYAFTELLYMHGDNLEQIADFFEEANSDPGKNERDLAGLFESRSGNASLMISMIEKKYKKVLKK